MTAKVIAMTYLSETCRTCRWHAPEDGYCQKQEEIVPDNYVCSWWTKRGPILWKPGENEDGD